ncbi:DNA-binding protein RFX2-like [Pollicipes pollicipes]|uniref:DNA-binding protein RFX2-like n=1 Tax=Pollicipes pollicipes TaxID=41117 RepID=UPI001884D486|nr:DNA-binding protein RFX2-like [Pollicipes pollicipes]
MPQLPTEDRQDAKKVKDALRTAFVVDKFVAYELFTARRLRAGGTGDVYLADLQRLASVFGGLSDEGLPSRHLSTNEVGPRALQPPPADVNAQLGSSSAERPSSASSGADSPAVVTTTLVAAPYITVTGDAGGSRSFAPLTPVNPSSAVVSEGGTVAASETAVAAGVGSTYVQQQYVDSSPEAGLYATTTNGQMAYPAVYAINDGTVTMYTGDGTFYTNGTQGQPVATQGQLLSGNTYMIHQPRVEGADGHPLMNNARGSQQTEQGGEQPAGAEQTVTYMMTAASAPPAPPTSEPSDPLAQATRVSPATSYDANCVQWLNDNYEVAEGVSLPRSTLYSHYLRHCADNKLDPVNAASFGKLIRQVFYGLRTRRLGTRGNSKYHYYGIRVKPDSPLNNLSDEVALASRQAGGHGKRPKRDDYQENSIDMHQTQQYLGDSSSAVPIVPDIDLTAQTLPDGVTEEDVTNFTSIYREHCEVLLDAVTTLQFSSVEIIWQQFWRSANNSEDMLDEDDPEKVMPKRVLHQLCDWPPVQDYVKTMDYLFYQNLVEVLIPDVLRAIPSTLTQAIRNFAKTLEGWLRSATESTPAGMVLVKLGAVSAFAQTLRRYTSLNHLAQAARAVLLNSGQISQMLSDLNRVDFVNVQEQASWVCQCDDGLVQRLEADFKVTLQQQNSLEQWASWLEEVVNTVLKPFEGKPEFPKAARQFLLKWSFYSSMVIRDLTLRSAASFGSFHLIRLLYDEYMFYLIENRVARATGEMPIAVMGDRSQHQHQHHQQQALAAAARESAFDNPSDLLMSNGPLLDPLSMERGDGDIKRMRRE